MADETKHKHNENGKRDKPNTITIGRELVTYQRVHCTCGKVMENAIIKRERKS